MTDKKDEQPTIEQVRRYVERGGVNCLHCYDDDVIGGPVEIDAGSATQEIKCTLCGRSWEDYYELKGVILPTREIIESALKPAPFPEHLEIKKPIGRRESNEGGLWVVFELDSGELAYFLFNPQNYGPYEIGIYKDLDEVKKTATELDEAGWNCCGDMNREGV